MGTFKSHHYSKRIEIVVPAVVVWPIYCFMSLFMGGVGEWVDELVNGLIGCQLEPPVEADAPCHPEHSLIIE